MFLRFGVLRGARSRVISGFVLAALSAVSSCAGPRPDSHPQLEPQQIRWLQAALDDWERCCVEFLHIDPVPLPWILVIGTEVTWHLEAPSDQGSPSVNTSLNLRGQPVSVHAVPGDGAVRLPTGQEIPRAGTAFAALAEDGTLPFFVVAMPEVWRLDPRAAGHPDLDGLIRGVLSHEIIHTRQLVDVGRRVAELRVSYPSMPESLHDDLIEELFQDVPEFVKAWELETELLFQAADEMDPTACKAKVREALRIAQRRRETFFVGANAFLSELEDLFLNMEGVAVWASHRLTAEPGVSMVEARAGNSWSQDEGFVLIALLERFDPNWRNPILGPELVAPFGLLAAALDAQE